TPKGNRTGARRFGLGALARPGTTAFLQPRLLAFYLARLERLRLWRSGDMGSYSFDTIFRVLKLEAPTSVEASSTDRYDDTYPIASIIYYDFAARCDMPPVSFTWYDGGLKPSRPDELEENRALRGEGEEDEEGMLVVG